jgi:hypothetical protein
MKYIWVSLMFFLIAPVFYLFTLTTGRVMPSQVLMIVWASLGLFYIVGFILHFTYYQNDKNKKITFHNSEVTLDDGIIAYTFNIDEIESITNYHSGLHNRAPWNEYEFTIFKLTDGNEFVVTCLLLDLQTIKEKFPERILILKNRFIAMLP